MDLQDKIEEAVWNNCYDRYNGLELSQATDSVMDVVNKHIETLEAAMRSALNYIENTENELDIKMQCGDDLRAALKHEEPET